MPYPSLPHTCPWFPVFWGVGKICIRTLELMDTPTNLKSQVKVGHTLDQSHCVQSRGPERVHQNHSFETPSTVDPQWNILYWGSKWNLQTVCWGEVGCEWWTTYVYLGLLMFALSLVDFLSLLWSPSTNIQIFFLWKVSFEGHAQNLKKNSCWFKICMGFIGQILIELRTSSIWDFL